MKKIAFFLMVWMSSFFCFSQGIKTNAYDKFLKKQRVETEPVNITGLSGKNRLSLDLSALAPELYLNLEGAGWGAATVDAGDKLILLFSNDSTITLRSATLQSFEPGLQQNTYRHRYVVTGRDLEALSRFDLQSIRKYSFQSFADLQIPAANAARIKKLSATFATELVKNNIGQEAKPIRLKDIRNYIGDSVIFCSRVYRTRYFEDSKDGPTLLDVQADFSDPFVNVVILQKDRAKFGNAPEKRYLNKDVCIHGVVTLRDNIPYIAIQDRSQINLQSPVSLTEISLFDGDSVTVTGRVFTARYLEDTKTKPTLLNVGAPYPDQPLTLVIENEDRKNFTTPEEEYQNKTLRIRGKVTSFKGKPQIALHNRQQIEVLPDAEPLTATTPASGGTVPATQGAAAQPASEKSPVGQLARTVASFPGGSDAFLRFLKSNLENPKTLGASEQRKVVAMFQIDEKGRCRNIKILQSGGDAFDEEVKRVLKKMPRWTPSAINGNPITADVIQPITFNGGNGF